MQKSGLTPINYLIARDLLYSSMLAKQELWQKATATFNADKDSKPLPERLKGLLKTVFQNESSEELASHYFEKKSGETKIDKLLRKIEKQEMLSNDQKLLKLSDKQKKLSSQVSSRQYILLYESLLVEEEPYPVIFQPITFPSTADSQAVAKYRNKSKEYQPLLDAHNNARLIFSEKSKCLQTSLRALKPGSAISIEESQILDNTIKDRNEAGKAYQTAKKALSDAAEQAGLMVVRVSDVSDCVLF